MMNTDDYDNLDYKKQFMRNNQNNNIYYYSQNNNEPKDIPYNTIYHSDQSGKDRIRKKYKIAIFCVILLIIGLSSFLVCTIGFKKSDKKERTFMIYMVGSDLETKSKQGTFSLSDIVGENIDLKNNNVVLMVGGAQKWHNDYVDPSEIGIFELTKAGFEKKKKLPIESMGASITLENFLNYTYQNYPSNNYDIIFWNHGLGAIGIEQDELSKDFLTISELDNAFKNSPFAKDKLELTIFYNCLASNIHIASIMKNYANYMVASEEIFYLSKVLNRLTFLESVSKDDSSYDVARLFVDQSDKVVSQYNNSHTKKIDSTLSIIDLNEIDGLVSELNTFIKSININQNYYSISSFRRNTHTYGIAQTYDYDMIDLTSLVKSLGKLSNNEELSNKVLTKIDNTIKYTSNLNDYSNGISIYFPYYGSDTSIATHLSLFEKVFNDDYYSFINNFYLIRNGTKKTRRSNNNNEVNKLTNNIVKNEDGSISISLTEEEKKNYQGGNIYIFSRNENKYDLILQSNKLKLQNNDIVFSNNKVLTVDDNIISYIDNGDNKLVYGKLSDKKDELSVKFSINKNKIEEVILDSENYISSSLVEYNDYSDVYFSKLTYNLFENDLFNEDFKESVEKTPIKSEKNKSIISLNNNEVTEYYVLFEMTDIYNDSYYSNLELIS